MGLRTPTALGPLHFEPMLLQQLLGLLASETLSPKPTTSLTTSFVKAELSKGSAVMLGGAAAAEGKPSCEAFETPVLAWSYSKVALAWKLRIRLRS